MHELELLRNVQIFESLTADELRSVRDNLILRRFKKNEVILYEEDTNKFMYAILEGKVKIVQNTEDGKEIIIAMHEAGDSFGEISLIDGKTATASVQATSDSLIAIITKQDFYELLFANRKLLDNLLRMLCSRIRENVDKIQLLNFNNAAQRIKMMLIKLADSHGKKTPDGTTLNIKLTHQDIANMTGLTRETVTRVLDKWQYDGDIAVQRDRSIMLNRTFLEEL